MTLKTEFSKMRRVRCFEDLCLRMNDRGTGSKRDEDF